MYLSAITYIYIHVCMLYILHISCMSRQLLIVQLLIVQFLNTS